MNVLFDAPTTTRPREHGGALDRAAARYGIERRRWLDLSTGINPNPYPLPPLAPESWYRLPDGTVMDALRLAAARYYRVDDPASIVPVPGSQAAIQWLPRLVPPSRVCVVGPTYNEHAAAWAGAGHRVAEVDEIPPPHERAAVLVLVNPNNPDGRTVPAERVLAETRHRLVVVDEAFADVTPEVSVAPWVGRENLVVLRSMGKAFGLAGLRLGFALCGRALAAALHEAMGPWAVSGPAAAVGTAALGDGDWMAGTRAALASARARLDTLLVRHGLAVVGGTDLFRLGATAEAQALYEHLARRGILTRAFASHSQWLRFGLPADDGDFARLDLALDDWTAPRTGAGTPSPEPGQGRTRARPLRES